MVWLICLLLATDGLSFLDICRSRTYYNEKGFEYTSCNCPSVYQQRNQTMEELERKLSIEKGNMNFLCEALCEIKELQDLINDVHTKYYGQLLVKLVGTDTIPFFLITKKGVRLSLIDTENQFETEYFRIESIDRERCRGTVSLLRALDFEGHDTNLIADVVRLERTSTKRSIELAFISAVQLVNLDLLKKKTIIEPKW